MVRSNFFTSESINKFIEALECNGNKVDVFIDIWDTQELYSPGVQKNLRRRLPMEIYKELGDKEKKIEYFSKNYPNFYKMLTTSIYSSLEKNYKSPILNTRKTNIESQKEFLAQNRLSEKPALLFKGNLNQAFMFHKISSCMKLADSYSEKHSIEYDVVIRMRPDTYIKKYHLDFVDDSEIDKAVKTMNLSGSEGFVGDILFYSNHRNMRNICSIGDKIIEAGTTDVFGDGTVTFSERLLTKTIEDRKLDYFKQDFIKGSFPSETFDYADKKVFPKKLAKKALDMDHLETSWSDLFLKKYTR